MLATSKNVHVYQARFESAQVEQAADVQRYGKLSGRQRRDWTRKRKILTSLAFGHKKL